jgi:hypothetical protein
VGRPAVAPVEFHRDQQAAASDGRWVPHRLIVDDAAITGSGELSYNSGPAEPATAGNFQVSTPELVAQPDP